MEPVVNPEQYERLCGHMPLQPDGMPRVLGVSSFAQLPVRGGEFLQEAAQHIGYRLPRLKGLA